MGLVSVDKRKQLKNLSAIMIQIYVYKVSGLRTGWYSPQVVKPIVSRNSLTKIVISHPLELVLQGILCACKQIIGYKLEVDLHKRSGMANRSINAFALESTMSTNVVQSCYHARKGCLETP